MQKGEPQKYGTQYRIDPVTKEITFIEIGDEEHLDERRAGMGLESHGEYKARAIESAKR